MSLFKALFKKGANKNEESKGVLDIDDMMLQDFLKWESTYRHQSFILPRFTKDNPATLGFIIKSLLPDCAGKIQDAICLSIAEFGGNPKTSRILDPKEIEELQPVGLSMYTSDTGEEYPIHGQNYTVLVRFLESAPISEVLFHIRGTGGFYHKSAYMRISVMIPPLGKEEDLHSGVPGAEGEQLSGINCASEQTSFLIVEDHVDNSALIAKYEEIEKEVERKIKSNEELTDHERTIYEGFSEFKHLSRYVSYGRWLAEQDRWFDAYRQFIRVWHMSHHVINNNPDEDPSWLYSLAFDLGKCLSHLGRLDEAAYFLELAKEKESEAEAELDSVYARLGDIRAKDPSSQIHRTLLKEATERPYEANMLTIGDMLGELFGAVPGSLICMALRNDDEDPALIIKDHEEVWRTPLSVLAKDKTTAIILYSPVGYITKNEEDKSKLCVNNTFIVRVHKANTGQDDGLLRMNIMLPTFNLDSEKMHLRRENVPEGMSIIVGTTDPPKVEGRFHTASFGHCYDLTQSGRFLESGHEAKYIFNRLLSRWEDLSDDERDDFFEAAYQVGYSYMDFRLMGKAQYYLEIAAQRRYVLYMQEYLNCLSNSFDPRTMSVIDTFLNMSFKEDAPKAINEWKCFLKRRKAYALVEARKYEEAKALLTELLNEPDPTNRDFAKNELAYIEDRMR